jgi:hypothetical protein
LLGLKSNFSGFWWYDQIIRHIKRN